MTPQARNAFSEVVNEALVDISGKAKLLAVQNALVDALEKGRFNSERAHQMFQMAIE